MDQGQQKKDEGLCVPLANLSPSPHFPLSQVGMNCVLELIHAESFGNQVETREISFRKVKCNYSGAGPDSDNWIWTCE